MATIELNPTLGQQFSRNFKRGAVDTLDTISALAKDPIKTIRDPRKSIENVRRIRTKGTKGERLGAGFEVAGQTALGVATLLNPLGVAKTGGKFLFGTPTRAGLTLVGAGALASSPTLRSTITDSPTSLVTTGTKLGKGVEDILNPAKPNGNQKKEDDKDLLKKLAGLGLGGALLAGGIGIAQKKIKDNSLTLPKLPTLSGKKSAVVTTPASVLPVTGAPVANMLSSATDAPVIDIPEPVKPKEDKKIKPVTINNNISIKNSNRQINKKFINKIDVK